MHLHWLVNYYIKNVILFTITQHLICNAKAKLNVDLV